MYRYFGFPKWEPEKNGSEVIKKTQHLKNNSVFKLKRTLGKINLKSDEQICPI